MIRRKKPYKTVSISYDEESWRAVSDWLCENLEEVSPSAAVRALVLQGAKVAGKEKEKADRFAVAVRKKRFKELSTSFDEESWEGVKRWMYDYDETRVSYAVRALVLLGSQFLNEGG